MSTYAVVDPATGETVKEYPTISDDDLRAAIGRADAAHSGWGASSTVADRAALARRGGGLRARRPAGGGGRCRGGGGRSSPKSSFARGESRWSRHSVRSISSATSTASTPT